MSNFKFCRRISRFWLLIIVLTLITNIQTTSKVPISRQFLLVETLQNIDDEISELSKKLSVQLRLEQFGFQDHSSKEISWTVSQKIQTGLSSLYQSLPQLSLFNVKSSPDQTVRAKQVCEINKNHSLSGQSNIKYHYFTSFGQLFIFVSDLLNQKLQIYSMNCELMARINSIVIKFLFEQQKSTSYHNYNTIDQSQNQLVYFISSKNQLLVIDLLEVKKKGKQTLLYKGEENHPKIYRLLNNKLVAHHQNLQVIGVLIKSVNHQSSKQSRSSGAYREKSLFVAFDSSEIKVFDQMGTQKISMKQPSIINDFYEEINPEPNSLLQVSDKALQFLDIHPQPILVEQNWIYFVDTSKYSRQPWSCPYIPNIKKIFVENYHDNEVFILTDERIFKVNIKGKDSKDLSKKGLCQFERSIPYFDPYLKQKKTDEITFTVYKNLIFLDNLVYNMTSSTYLTIASANSSLNKQFQNNPHCNQFSLQPFPNIPPSSKKTPLEKYLTFIHLCQNPNQTLLQIFKVTQIKSETSLLVYIIVGFLMVIFFAVKCFKSTGSNYEKELLYPINFDAEEREVRKEHYEQLKKYMDEAKRVEDEQKKNKTQKVQKADKKDVNKKQTIKKQSKLKKQ